MRRIAAEYWVTDDRHQPEMPSNIGWPIPWDEADGDRILSQC